MKKFSDKEEYDLLKKVNYPSGLTIYQTIKTIWWAYARKRKYNKMLEFIEDGKSLIFAYNDSK